MIIEFPIEARFVERINRFLVLAEISGKRERIHLRDPGRLEELLIPGSDMLVMPRERRSRKTAYETLAVKSGKDWVIVNSGLHGALAEELIGNEGVPILSEYQVISKEVTVGRSRIDFLLLGEKLTFLETKGCTLVRNGVALFPDAPTERGRRHLEELIRIKREGYDAITLFLITRKDGELVSPNYEMDPKFGETLKRAHAEGVHVLAHSFGMIENRVSPHEPIPVTLSGDLKRVKELLNVLKGTVRIYNNYRAPESVATLLEIDENAFAVSFKGTSCLSCGTYDYFDDLCYELEDAGDLRTKIVRVNRILNTFKVGYAIVNG